MTASNLPNFPECSLSLCTLTGLLLLGCLGGERGSEGKTSLLTGPPDGEETDVGEDGGPGAPGGSGGDDTDEGGDDNDGDGYAAGADCDDNDASINPGVSSDDCDGLDDDCDNLIDENASIDDYERDDSSEGGVDLGELTEETAKITTFLTPDADIDAYYLYLDDGIFSWFDLDLDLEVPGGIDMVIDLFWWDDDAGDWLLVESIDEGGDGRNESLTYEGGVGDSDTGWYGVLVYGLYGSSCQDAYTLHIEG